MDFFETVANRHSCRSFDSKPVEDARLRKILEACNSAPSAHNSQAYKIFVVKDKTRRIALAAACLGQVFVSAAPVVLVFCHEKKAGLMQRGGVFPIQDATIAASYCQLAATAQGLGSVWVGAFSPSLVRKIVGAPDDLEPLAVIPIGYAKGALRKTPRKKLEELVVGF